MAATYVCQLTRAIVLDDNDIMSGKGNYRAGGIRQAAGK